MRGGRKSERERRNLLVKNLSNKFPTIPIPLRLSLLRRRSFSIHIRHKRGMEHLFQKTFVESFLIAIKEDIHQEVPISAPVFHYNVPRSNLLCPVYRKNGILCEWGTKGKILYGTSGKAFLRCGNSFMSEQSFKKFRSFLSRELQLHRKRTKSGPSQHYHDSTVFHKIPHGELLKFLSEDSKTFPI